jgi:hypothetical protein
MATKAKALQAAKIKHVEQRCYHCHKWFVLDNVSVKLLKTRLIENPMMVEMKGMHCTHCNTDNVLLDIGKCDKVGTPKNKCACQFVKL